MCLYFYMTYIYVYVYTQHSHTLMYVYVSVCACMFVCIHVSVCVCTRVCVCNIYLVYIQEIANFNSLSCLFLCSEIMCEFDCSLTKSKIISTSLFINL